MGEGDNADFEGPTLDAGLDWRYDLGGGFLGLQNLDESFDQGGENNEFTISAGVFLRAYVAQDFYLEGRASQLARETDSGTFSFTEEATVLSAQIGWEF